MPTMEEYAKQPREQRIKRLERTADELAAAIRGQSDAALARRPDAKNWAAKEVVCHLRDVEESFRMRFDTILAVDNPPLAGVDPDRWAEERQYLRNDAGEAAAAFRRRREDSLAVMKKLGPADWERACCLCLCQMRWAKVSTFWRTYDVSIRSGACARKPRRRTGTMQKKEFT